MGPIHCNGCLGFLFDSAYSNGRNLPVSRHQDVVGDILARVQVAQARLLQRIGMNEDIAASIIRFDESVALADTEKDYPPSFHRVPLLTNRPKIRCHKGNWRKIQRRINNLC